MILDLSKFERHELKVIRINYLDPAFDTKVGTLLDGTNAGKVIKVVGVMTTTLALLVFYVESAEARG